MIKRLLMYVFLSSMLGLISGCGKNKADFVLVNNSNEKIISGSVSLLKQSIKVGSIDAGGIVNGGFIIETDSHYHVEVQFESGRKIGKDVGYVTRGFDFNDEIIVSSNDVSIQSKKIEGSD